MRVSGNFRLNPNPACHQQVCLLSFASHNTRSPLGLAAGLSASTSRIILQ